MFFLTKKKQFARSDLTFLILGVERSDFVRFLEIIFLKFESKIEMLTWVLSKSQNLKIDFQKISKFSKLYILISKFVIIREKLISDVYFIRVIFWPTKQVSQSWDFQSLGIYLITYPFKENLSRKLEGGFLIFFKSQPIWTGDF